MARDVEFNATASDKTGPGLASVGRSFKRTQKGIEGDSSKFGKTLTKAFGTSVTDMGKTLTDTLQKIGPVGAGILAAGLAVAFPAVGAGLAAAIIGGAGIGGVVGGVMLAARDPRVKAAGKSLGARILSSLEFQASPFIAPVLRSIDQIGKAYFEVAGNVGNILRNASRFLAPLTKGATDFGQSIIKGIDVLVANGGPVIEAIGYSMTRIGAAAEEFFQLVAQGGPGAAQFLRDFADAAGDLLVFIGGMISDLSRFYAIIRGADGPTKMMKSSTDAATMAFQANADAAAADAKAITDLNASMDEYRANNATLLGSQIAAKEAISQSTKAILENGRATGVNTEKGRANSKALLDVAGKFNQLQAATEKSNGAGSVANDVAAANYKAFLRLAHQSGLSAGAAQNLANQLLKVPTKTNTTAKFEKRAAQMALGTYETGLNRIPTSKTTTMTVVFKQVGRPFSGITGIGGSTARGYDASPSWSPSSGAPRTGGPARVSVQNDTHVYLDGAPFYARVRNETRQSSARDAWRLRVGSV